MENTKAVANAITEYFILNKRWLRKRGRRILFNEGDSERLAKIIIRKYFENDAARIGAELAGDPAVEARILKRINEDLQTSNSQLAEALKVWMELADIYKKYVDASGITLEDLKTLELLVKRIEGIKKGMGVV